MAKKGSGNSLDDIRKAIEESGGDALRAASILGVTRTSYYNYVNRYPELKELAKEVRGREPQPDAQTDAEWIESDDPNDAPVLSKKQIEALERIDKDSNKGELWAYVGEISTSVLLKLEERGMIQLRYEDGGKWAMLSDEGEIAMLWHVEQGSREWELLMAGKGKPVRRKAEKAESINIRKNIQPLPSENLEQTISEMFPSPQPISQVIGHENGATDCNDCAECLHREVLAYIMERVPEAKELYDGIAALKANQKKVDAVLKKIGG